MPAVSIPQKLRALLEHAPCESPTLALADAVGTVLASNTLPFFPAYTDHGSEHVERLLDACVRLIPDAVWLEEDLLCDVDAAVLVGACLLHDLAMHIRDPGFVELVDRDTRFVPRLWRSSSGSGPEQPWSTLWAEFQREARHFGTSQLELLFGPQGRGVPAVAYQSRLEPDDWTEADRLLIGEFLRRHHARIAHEIAVYGLPAAEPEFPVLADTLPSLADAIGAVARSHGEPLRTVAAYLDWLHPGSKRPDGALLLYHMGLLRVADYLQIEARRAPPLLLRLKAPQSPLSVEEWNKHEAVSSLTWDHADPQAIYVAVSPDHGLRTHLALGELFRDMQREMDTTHAVLSEAYSSSELAQLRLSKQRIVSNLDEPSMHQRLPYVPRRAALRSDPDLFRLVIGDLYGNDPVIAGRELVQNAADAVRARQFWEKRHGGELATVELRQLPADVVVCVEEDPDGRCKLCVTDSGIGMTPDLVIGYYLQAGASFGPTRGELEELDHGDAILSMRAGRFGIGAFAAFLLGPELRVRTRHVTSERGIEFSARIDEDLVEIRWVDAPVGTEIVVPFTRDSLPPGPWPEGAPLTVDELLRDVAQYYRLRSPRVLFEHQRDGASQRSPAPGDVPSPLQRLPDRWRKVTAEPFDAILWHVPPANPLSSDEFASFEGGMVAHNGIVICAPGKFGEAGVYKWSEIALRLILRRPNLAIFDSQHKLGVSLQRYWLTESVLPFEELLVRAIGEDIVAHALVAGPTRHPLLAQSSISRIQGQSGWLPPLAPLLRRYTSGSLFVIWRFDEGSAGETDRLAVTRALSVRESPVSWTSFPHRAAIDLGHFAFEHRERDEASEWKFSLGDVARAASDWARFMGAGASTTVVLRGDPEDDSQQFTAVRDDSGKPTGWRRLGAAAASFETGTFVSGDTAGDPAVEANLIEAARALVSPGSDQAIAVSAFGGFTLGVAAHEWLGEAWVRTIDGELPWSTDDRVAIAAAVEDADEAIKQLTAKWRRSLARET